VKLSIRPRRRLPPRSAFAGFRFPAEVIVVAVRWYLRFNLSYRDVEELLLERGVEVDHVSVYRWVQRFAPPLADAARFCRHAPGDRWHVDETYVRVNGVWRYVYRAVDQYGQVIDVLVSVRRDADAARRFFRRALSTLKVTPTVVVTDAAPVYPAVLDELIPSAWHHVERYANNPIEADQASSRGEFRPPALSEPCVNLSELFRTRNNSDYAESRIMPSSPVRVGVVAARGGCARWAPRHNQRASRKASSLSVGR
jgi:transposase-like protein